MNNARQREAQRQQLLLRTLWRDAPAWWHRAVLNTAGMGWFSSDRTILEYARDIWTAVPSRPADPPNRCVSTVPPNTSGAIRLGTHAVASWISSMIIAVPPLARPPTW